MNNIIVGLIALIGILNADSKLNLSPYQQLQLAVRKSEFNKVRQLLHDNKAPLFSDNNEENKAEIRELAKRRLAVQEQKLICNFSELTKYGYYLLFSTLFAGTLIGIPIIRKLLLRHRHLSILAANGTSLNEYKKSLGILGMSALGEAWLMCSILMVLVEIKNRRSVKQKIIEASEIKHILNQL